MEKRLSSASAGFTLIEVLVALLVLSVGLLGVAALQLRALQGAHVAYQHAIAALAAQDAQERLWAGVTRDVDGNLSCPSVGIVNGSGGWHGQWSRFLPGLDASPVARDGCEFIVTIAWEEVRFAAEDTPAFVYIVRLPGE